ncbi:MAG: anion transporter [Thermodesulfobacteriota bacterium]
MDGTVLGIFVLVYAGMMVGDVPGLVIDRTGIALLGAIALLATERVGIDEAWQAVDVPTIALLFGLMIVSAQLRQGGFYALVTRRLAAHDATPDRLLALLIAAVGALSAVLVNDIVCLAMTPVLVEVCARRRLDPVPFLLALACAANVGSAATLIGNPQNMLVGQTLHLSFPGYLLDASLPVVLGLGVVWLVIRAAHGRSWHASTPLPVPEDAHFDAWQSTKGLLVLGGAVLLFLVSSLPRELVALTGAGILLVSRQTASRDTLALVDWQLLILFLGLFVVNHAFSESGAAAALLRDAAAAGVDLRQPGWLFVATAALSNLVSNVPAVMLLLPAATDPLAGPVLALASTLAGNLIVVGSIANIIVLEQAARLGIDVDWRTHARVGVPVTLATLVIAAAWLWLRAG